MFRNGTIVIEGGQRLSVAIKDLSEHGARIEFVRRMDLPSVVILMEPMLKLRCRARVVWQREGIAGLEF
jgi:hypothetical protein